ncbi:MAG: DUF349 domain-containing protein [Bacteroidota bacterium]
MLDGNTENLSKDNEEKKSIQETEITNEESDGVIKKIKDEQVIAEEKVEEVVEEKVEEPLSDDKPKEIKEESTVETAKTKEDSQKNIENKREESKKEGDSDEILENKSTTDKEKSKEEIPVLDYAKLSLEELAEEFDNLLNNFPVKDIKNQFEEIKSNFNKKYKLVVEVEKDKFVKEGGEVGDFKFITPVKSKFFDLIREFKKKRQYHYKQIERERKDNLENKLTVIEKLKILIENAEPSTMYKEFKELQNEWRAIGQIPRTKYNDVWQTYHHHVERFYDLLHLNRDFIDLDFKHNLEEKTKLVETAEKLAEMEDVDKAFRELQVLHRMWKEDIGPVAREYRDEIWNRFSDATKKIHHKRHEIQKDLDAKFEENVGKKLLVIEKIKSINIDDISSHKEWQNAIRNIEQLRKDFFAIGRVPSSKNEEIWNLFKGATRDFNRSKNAFYKSIKKEQNENLTKKMHLVNQAESLKESEDWNTVTDIFKKIQADWKKIGHVPKKDSDEIWKRFKDACNHYFDRLNNRQDDANKEFIDVFNSKKELLSKLKEAISQEEEIDIEKVNSFISEWRDLGALPVKMHHIEAKFNKALESAYKKSGIDKDEAVFLKFKNIVDFYVDQKDTRKIEGEQFFVRKKIDDLTREVKQLENNVSFISNVSDDNPLVKNVLDKIEGYKNDLQVWKRKIDYLKKLEY